MKIAVLGAGMQGTACAYDLIQNREVKEVALADSEKSRADAAAKHLPSNSVVKTFALDVQNHPELVDFLKPYDVVISAVPYFLNPGITKAAIESGTHMVDMGGNTDLVFEQRKLHDAAVKNNVTILPDCGLAPGMANIIAAHAIHQMDKTESVQIRVGGLPQNPQPPLNYRLFFSVHGLINEYVGKAVVLKDGKIQHVDTLSDLEELQFDSVGLCEAFNTLGGLSTLPWTYEGKIKNMNYKTIRYPGHCHQIKTMNDLGLFGEDPVQVNGVSVRPRDVFAAVAVPRLSFEDNADIVLVRVAVEGWQKGEPVELVYEITDRYDAKSKLTAMMRTTAFPVSIVAQMMGDGTITERGVLALETAVPTQAFMDELPKRNIRAQESLKKAEALSL